VSASCPGSKPPHSAARTDEHVLTPQKGRLHLLGPLFFLLLLVSNARKVRLGRKGQMARVKVGRKATQNKAAVLRKGWREHPRGFETA